MTICIGIRAHDGVVIAADAQETLGDFKRHTQKILPFCGPIGLGNNPQTPTMACLFTGAGEAGYLDAFFDFALKDINTGLNGTEFEKFLSEKTRTFHETHLFPLASSPNRPEIEVLIGSFCLWGTSMFVTYGSTLRRVAPIAAVGIGAHFAQSVMSELPYPQDVNHAELIAAYAIAATKEHIEGCGNYTTIYTLHNSTIVEGESGQGSHLVRPTQLFTHVSQRKIRKWEESFGDRWARRQTDLIAELIEEELASDEF